MSLSMINPFILNANAFAIVDLPEAGKPVMAIIIFYTVDGPRQTVYGHCSQPIPKFFARYDIVKSKNSF